jgi:hypothetical protein
MQIVTRIIAMVRARQLQRQFSQIDRTVAAMPAKSEFPHLYGTEPGARYLPWGQGTDVGFSRAQSDNPEVALRGISLWLAVAYHETKDSAHASVQPQHRQVLRVLRELRDASGEQVDAVAQWMRSGAAA